MSGTLADQIEKETKKLLGMPLVTNYYPSSFPARILGKRKEMLDCTVQGVTFVAYCAQKARTPHILEIYQRDADSTVIIRILQRQRGEKGPEAFYEICWSIRKLSCGW